jgi:hypothetical protein
MKFKDTVNVSRYSRKYKPNPAQKPKHKEQDRNSCICLDLDFKYSLGVESI